MTTTTTTETTPFDTRAFRNALGSFPTGVAVITTVHGGELVGLTCNSFSSVSLEPPLVLWSLRRESRALDAFRNGPGFAINILAEDQAGLSAHFASRVEDKFGKVAWRPGLRGLPVLGSSLATFECSTFAQHEAGDHVIFIGQVERFEQARSDDPLVFSRGAYMRLSESLREMMAQGRISAEALSESRTLVFSMLLRQAVHRATEDDFSALEASIAKIDSLANPGHEAARVTAAVNFLELITQAAHNEALAVVASTLTTLLLHNASASKGSSPAQRAALAVTRSDLVAALRHRDEAAALAAWARYIELVHAASADVPSSDAS